MLMFEIEIITDGGRKNADRRENEADKGILAVAWRNGVVIAVSVAQTHARWGL
ncbi:MAG: hypothetical protein HEP69_19180 [Aestuariivita sp.]|jgi:hypothetical protein|nr:hypothetical protein [Aestuariivita sp.]